MILNKSTYPQTPANSTTYADVVGIPFGLNRLEGEPADAYLNRLAAAAQLRRDSPYEGLLNEINLQLGILPSVGMTLTDTTGSFTASVSLTGIAMTNASETLLVPLNSYGPDDFWTWRPLADLAAQINQSNTFSAAIPQNGFSYQLAWQSNRTYVSSEAIAGQTVRLAHPGVVSSSLVFSTVVPAYTVGTDNQTLHFAAPLPAGSMVSYSYQQCPWNLVASPVGIISLLDPALPQVAIAPSGAIAYQVREYLQAVAISDSSYWAG